MCVIRELVVERSVNFVLWLFTKKSNESSDIISVILRQCVETQRSDKSDCPNDYWLLLSHWSLPNLRGVGAGVLLEPASLRSQISLISWIFDI